jgi:signal transduction histidine kinase
MAGAALQSPTTGLEPGLHRMLRILAVLHVFGASVVRRAVSSAMGLSAPHLPSLMLALPIPLLLLGLVWIPSWEGRRGRVLLPVALGIASINLLADKFLTLSWLDAPAERELDGVLLLVRLWVTFHVVTLLVAWQYLWRPAVVSALVLCAADFALSLQFNRPGPLYPLFLLLSVARMATVALVATCVGWVVQKQREQRMALAAANRKLAAYAATSEQLAISRERNRMARELHDTLAHSLSAVTVQLEAIQALWSVNLQSAQTMLASALENARTGLAEARRALKALRASPLGDEGLNVAIGNLARSAAARANFDLDLHGLTDGTGLRAEQEHFLYRVAQEALTNVVRHARATRVRVALERADGALTLIVADDGGGFDRSSVDTTLHFGLTGMEERADAIGGQLVVESGRGHGTAVRLDIALEDGA